MSRLHLYFLLILREPHVEFAMLRGRSLPPVHGEELRLGLSGPGFAPEIRVNAVLCGWVWNVDLLQPGAGSGGAYCVFHVPGVPSLVHDSESESEGRHTYQQGHIGS